MLLAVESHPAMLFYLDNAGSIGPNSVAGINRNRGLNENLAREILELHTLGVASGYTQDDVVSFRQGAHGLDLPARRRQSRARRRVQSSIGACTSRDRRPCSARSTPTTGVEQGRAVLRDLARHPATAKHVATKLARHFVADEPPPALVERLARDLPRTPTATSRRWPARWSRRRRPGPRRAASSSARANG